VDDFPEILQWDAAEPRLPLSTPSRDAPRFLQLEGVTEILVW
jgi:hypothetical protein